MKNDEIIKNINNGLIEFEIPENENPRKAVNIVETLFAFTKEYKGKRLKVLIPKQMLERLPIALAQVKAGNISKNLLTEIRQIKYL